MREIEDRWLAYAHRVVGDDGHRVHCTMERLGAPPGNDGGGVRWPGYLGMAYEPGGLLCGGKVHTNFASAGLEGESALVARAVAATRGWCDGRTSDAEWLAANRALYRRGLAPGGWRVGTHFRRALSALGEDEATIAYANAARCQWQGKAPKRFANPCLVAFPWTELVEVLEPRLVLTTEAGVADQLDGVVPVLHFHQLNGLTLRPFAHGRVTCSKGERCKVWALALSEGFRADRPIPLEARRG